MLCARVNALRSEFTELNENRMFNTSATTTVKEVFKPH